MFRIILFAPLILLFHPSSDAATWHILPDGTGDAPTIQAGIDSAAAGDTVLVGCGTYREYNVRMKSGICLRSETGEPECAVIDAAGLGRVLIGEWVDNRSRIEGLTLTGGHAVGIHPEYHGGGLYLRNSSPHVRNCVFTKNEADWLGGGMFCYEFASPTIDDCLFIGNRAYRGGGLGQFNASPQYRDCLVQGNAADDLGGGAAVGDDCLGSFQGCLFAKNTSRDAGGAYCVDARTGFVGCEFRDNEATRNGGGVFFLLCSGIRARLIDCLVIGNRARAGAGVRIDRSAPQIKGCVISGNVAVDRAGGIHVYEDADPLIEYCVVSGNSAAIGGGMVAEYISDPVVQNCTFYGNVGNQAGGIYVDRYSDIEVENTIIAFSERSEAVACGDHSTATLSCTNVFGNAGWDWVGCVQGQQGVNGNFSGDPLFCGASSGDFTLAATSPCLPGHHPTGYDCGLIGAFGEGCSGPTAVEHTSWGSVKRSFR